MKSKLEGLESQISEAKGQDRDLDHVIAATSILYRVVTRLETIHRP